MFANKEMFAAPTDLKPGDIELATGHDKTNNLFISIMTYQGNLVVVSTEEKDIKDRNRCVILLSLHRPSMVMFFRKQISARDIQYMRCILYINPTGSALVALMHNPADLTKRDNLQTVLYVDIDSRDPMTVVEIGDNRFLVEQQFQMLRPNLPPMIQSKPYPHTWIGCGDVPEPGGVGHCKKS